MLPNRKIKEINLQRGNKKTIIQYGGAEGEVPVAQEVSEEKEVKAEAVAAVEAIPLKEEAPDYKAPGILASLSKYSASVLLQAIAIAKSAILKQLNVETKPGQSSAELFEEVNQILEDPKTRISFLNFAKNIADKGLSFIQVARPVANKSIEAVVEIFDEIAAKGGKSVVKIGKDVATEIPVLGAVMGFIFMCDDIVKFIQSGIAAIFQTGTKANEIVVNTRSKMEGAQDLTKASPDIQESAKDVEKAEKQGIDQVISSMQERIDKLQEEVEKGKSSSSRANSSISELKKSDEPPALPKGEEKEEVKETVGGGRRNKKKSSKMKHKSMKHYITKKRCKKY